MLRGFKGRAEEREDFLFQWASVMGAFRGNWRERERHAFVLRVFYAGFEPSIFLITMFIC